MITLFRACMGRNDGELHFLEQCKSYCETSWYDNVEIIAERTYPMLHVLANICCKIESNAARKVSVLNKKQACYINWQLISIFEAL